MPNPREPNTPPEVTRDELDELRRELQAANEEMAQRKADRDEDHPRTVGPITANVVAAFIVAGALGLLAFAASFLRTNTPFAIWVSVSTCAGIITAVFWDFAAKRAVQFLRSGAVPRTRGLAILLIMVGVASLVVFLILGAIITDVLSVGEDGRIMTWTSLAVGNLAGLTLGVLGGEGWLQRLWKL